MNVPDGWRAATLGELAVRADLDDTALAAVQAALTRIGDPYVWGATGPDQFNCSGLMVWAYKQAGKTLPRSSEAQLGGGTAGAGAARRAGGPAGGQQQRRGN